MIDRLMNGTTMQKGLFLMIAGISGVFVVLVIFFFLIKLLAKLFPEKNESTEE